MGSGYFSLNVYIEWGLVMIFWKVWRKYGWLDLCVSWGSVVLSGL